MVPDTNPQPEAPLTPAPAADAVSTPPQAAPPVVASELVLPVSVVTRSDVSRSLREIGMLDDFFHQAAIRGSQAQTMPAISKTLDGLAVANNLNLIHPEARSVLKEFLTSLKAKAPVVHISFPSEASGPFLAKILEWFRREVHPHVVLHVGLQPELAAGCLVRTTNKLLDFSFRKRFEQSKQKLITALEAMDKQPERAVVAEATATVAPENQL